MSHPQPFRRHFWLIVPTCTTVLLAFTLSAHAGTSLKRPADRDGDGLTNEQEVALGTNPKRADSDRDGLSDGMEVHETGTNPRDIDSDDDGLSDRQEASLGTEGVDADSDDDGVDDGEEIEDGTDPTDPDTDEDGVPDGEDDDLDEEDAAEFEIEGTVLSVAEGCILTLSSSPNPIDASAATLEGAASCADLVHQEVEIEGEIIEGMLKAKKVEVDD